MKTGKELQLRRIAMDVSQQDLALAMGVAQSKLSRWENARQVKPEQAAAYLRGLATFGTIPTIDINVGASA